MLTTEALRNEGFDFLTQSRRAGATENVLGPATEECDALGGVDGDDGVGRGVQDRTQAILPDLCPQRLGSVVKKDRDAIRGGIHVRIDPAVSDRRERLELDHLTDS